MTDARHVFAVTEGGRLDVVVAAALPELSRTRASALIDEGQVEVDGVVVLRPSVRVAPGAAVQVVVPAALPSEAQAQDLPIHVVYSDEDIVIIDKVPGMVVHPSAGHADGTLVNALLHHIGDLSGIGGVQRPGIVHRLDRGTSGLLVVARNDVAHRSLSEQFAAHTARRRYLAICFGVPGRPSGTIRTHIGRHPTDRFRFASVDAKMPDPAEHGRAATTHWRVLGTHGGFSLMECALETGRTHQIRVHLSEQGWPLVGDGAYRGRRPPPDGLAPEDRPMLHAWRLDLQHPRHGRRVSFQAPPPEDFMAMLTRLKLSLPEQVG